MIKLIRFLKPFKFFVASVIILVFFQSMTELYLPKLMSDIVNEGIFNGNTKYIIRVGLIMLLVALAGSIGSITASYLSSVVASGFGRDVRKKIFTNVESFSLHEFDKLGTASLITRTTNDVTQVQNVLIMILRMMISAPMMAIGGIIMAVSTNARLSLVLVVVIAFLSMVIFIIAKKGIPLYKSMQIKLDKLNLVLRENLTGVRVIRAFNRTEHEKKRFNNANRDLTQTAVKVNKIMAVLMPVLMVVMNLTTVAVIWFGSIQIDKGTMMVGDMIAFIQYSMQIMFSLIMVSMMFVMIPRASASAVRINEVLDIATEIKDIDNADESQDKKRGYIEFKDVTFSYHGAEQPAVSNITFSACPGEVTAIIGSTGSGKTTLINLIPRFYDLDSGNILINGKDIRKTTQKSLREKIGYVSQKAVLFSGTIAENIRFGKENATMDEIKNACEVAQAAEFISTMKDGYESVISQGGTNISGGQKQRLTIARAVVKKPQIYVFDDSFSALDFKTDAKLRMALKKETADSTVIIVAQRVSTVLDADRIIVIEEGKIAGIGTHKELLNDCEVYREIVFSQLAEEEIA